MTSQDAIDLETIEREAANWRQQWESAQLGISASLDVNVGMIHLPSKVALTMTQALS